MTLGAAFQNGLILSSPAVVYALVQAGRGRPAGHIRDTLGLRPGDARSYAYAVAAALPFCVFAGWASRWTASYKGSTIAPFVGLSPDVHSIARALAYGFVATGIPEELLFRGLLQGTLRRRMPFWAANLLQTAIFALPHLLILLVAPDLWALVLAGSLTNGLLAGWLREGSGSIGPPALLHSLPNAAGALAVFAWRL